MFWPIAAIAVLLGAELWGAKGIRNNLPAPYGDTAVHLIAVTLIVVVFLLLDGLIRRFYWHGYVRRADGPRRAGRCCADPCSPWRWSFWASRSGFRSLRASPSPAS